MEIELINVGRNNVCKSLTVKDEKAMWKELSRHILSKNIELNPFEDSNKYDIWVGIRVVGQIIIKK